MSTPQHDTQQAWREHAARAYASGTDERVGGITADEADEARIRISKTPTVQEFAELVLAQTKACLAAHHSQEQADWETVEVHPGPVYTKVDLGPASNISGRFMIENATGRIYGIKGYGRVHKGRCYGTLDTVREYYWGGYTPEKREQS